GSRVAEPAGREADARLSGEPRTGAAAGARLGRDLAAASLLLTREAGADGTVARRPRRGAGGRSGADRAGDYRKGTRGAGRCAGARGLDYAAGTSGVSDLDGAVVAGASGRGSAADRGAAQISRVRAGAGRGNCARRF